MARFKKGHTQMQWEAKFFQCDCCCVYCGTPLLMSQATKDHLVPISRGGTDDISNVVPACFPCNCKKGKKTEQEFRASRRVYRTVFPTAQTKITTIPLPQERFRDHQYISTERLEEKDEPGLLDRLCRERDGRVSWAWRNPA
jgi:hypothetical protein